MTNTARTQKQLPRADRSSAVRFHSSQTQALQARNSSPQDECHDQASRHRAQPSTTSAMTTDSDKTATMNLLFARHFTGQPSPTTEASTTPPPPASLSGEGVAGAKKTSRQAREPRVLQQAFVLRCPCKGYLVHLTTTGLQEQTPQLITLSPMSYQ